jgi:hypothetical protein
MNIYKAFLLLMVSAKAECREMPIQQTFITQKYGGKISESENEPNRTRTGFLKVQSNRTELEPDDLGSVCVYGSSEF